MPRIKITIADGGKVTLEAEGFTGPSCRKALEPLTAHLKNVREEPTSEYHAVAVTEEVRGQTIE